MASGFAASSWRQTAASPTIRPTARRCGSRRSPRAWARSQPPPPCASRARPAPRARTAAAGWRAAADHALGQQPESIDADELALRGRARRARRRCAVVACRRGSRRRRARSWPVGARVVAGGLRRRGVHASCASRHAGRTRPGRRIGSRQRAGPGRRAATQAAGRPELRQSAASSRHHDPERRRAAELARRRELKHGHTSESRLRGRSSVREPPRGAAYPDDLRRQVEALPRSDLRSPTADGDRRPRGGDALLAAGGRQADPAGAGAGDRARSGMDPSRRAAARRRDRAHPHLLADPRRPAGDGRRRAAPRPADLPRRYGEDVAILAGDGLYAEAFALVLAEQRGDPRACSRPWRELADGTGRAAGWSAASTSTSPRARARRDGLRRLHELKTGRLIGASRRRACSCWRIDDQRATTPYRRFAAELGVLFQIVDDILDVTGTDDAAGQAAGQRRAPRQAHLREPVRARRGRGSWRRSRTARPAPRCAEAPRGRRPSSRRSPTSSCTRTS